MRILPALVLISVLAPARFLVAQDPGASVTVRLAEPENKPVLEPPKGRITGTVFCNDTRSPGRGALVMVSPLPKSSDEDLMNQAGEPVRAGLDGTYTMEHVAAGEYMVVAFLPGYLSPLDGFLGADMKNGGSSKLREALAHYGTVKISAGGTGTFNIALDRGVAFSGRVQYSDGSPASQVTLDIQNRAAKIVDSTNEDDRLDVSRVAHGLLTHENFNTDDRGHFRIAGLPPGSYRVAAVPPLPRSVANSPSDGFNLFFTGIPDSMGMRFYSGDTLHQKDAKVYETRAGDEISDIDITIPVDAFHLVSGTLTSKDGRPAHAAGLTLTDTTDDTLVFRARPLQDGTFTFPAVPSGSYTLASSQARSGDTPGVPGLITIQDGTPQTTTTFADGNTGVMVKDSDVTDVSLQLDEVPAPKTPATEATKTPPAIVPDPQI